MNKPQVLTGHTSEETAYVLADYPYGFQKRCQIRFWVETNKHGQRICSQTTNPDKPGTVWNKVKKSTYADLRVLYIDPTTKHVKDSGISHHASKKQVDDFLGSYGPENFADEYSSKTLELMKKYRQIQMERFADKPDVIQVGAADPRPALIQEINGVVVDGAGIPIVNPTE